MRTVVALIFSRTLVTAAVVTPLLCLALAGRSWLEKRFAPKARRFLWWGVGLILIVGAVYPGVRAVSPAIRVEVPSYTVTLPAPRQEKQPAAALPQAVGTSPATVPAAVTPIVPPTPPAPAARRVAFADLLGWVWALGAAAMALFQAVQYHWTRRNWIKQSRRLADTETVGTQWKALGSELGVRAEFRVLAGLDGPVTLGLVRPAIFLPEGEVHPMAVRHELTHVALRDLWLKWLLLLDRAIYWFHPLVWLSLPAAGRDIEVACDARVVEGLGTEEKRSYGELLLSAAAGSRGTAYATRFGGGAAQMRSRLTQLFRPGRAGRAVFAVALAVTLLAASLVACESGGTLADGTYYGTYDVFETMKKDAYDAVEVSLVDYDPAENWFVPQGKTVTLPLAEELTLRGKRVAGDREKVISEFLMWPLFRSAVYPGCEDVLELTVSGGEVTAMVRHEGARGLVGQVYENAQKDFSLRLPESWNGSVLAVEKFINAPGWAVDFYDAELYREGQGEGLLLQVLLYPEEQTDLTARMKPAGEGSGWWAYYTWPQTLPVEDEAVRDRYIRMYDDGQKLTEEDFTALGGEPADAGETDWLDVVRPEQEEQQRLAALSSHPSLDMDALRFFTGEELDALGYVRSKAFREGCAFAPIENAPASLEQFLEQLDGQFVPELAEREVNYALRPDNSPGSNAPCMFADGKMWHRVTGWKANTWLEPDWDTFTVLDSGEDFVTYEISGWSNSYSGGRKWMTRQYTLSRGSDGVWRYSDVGWWEPPVQEEEPDQEEPEQEPDTEG